MSHVFCETSPHSSDKVLRSGLRQSIWGHGRDALLIALHPFYSTYLFLAAKFNFLITQQENACLVEEMINFHQDLCL